METFRETDVSRERLRYEMREEMEEKRKDGTDPGVRISPKLSRLVNARGVHSTP